MVPSPVQMNVHGRTACAVETPGNGWGTVVKPATGKVRRLAPIVVEEAPGTEPRVSPLMWGGGLVRALVVKPLFVGALRLSLGNGPGAERVFYPRLRARGVDQMFVQKGVSPPLVIIRLMACWPRGCAPLCWSTAVVLAL